MKQWGFIALGLLINAAQAQTPDTAVNAPVFSPGDSWEYRFIPRVVTSCNPNKPYYVSDTVLSVKDGEIKAYLGGRSVTLNPNLAELQQVNGESNVYDPYNFPMAAGKKWDQRRLIGRGDRGALQTKLVCTQKSMEYITVPAGRFNAVPIVCEGFWNNGPASGPAEYKYWYAPSVKNLIKNEIVTRYNQGDRCSDLEGVLINYSVKTPSDRALGETESRTVQTPAWIASLPKVSAASKMRIEAMYVPSGRVHKAIAVTERGNWWIAQDRPTLEQAVADAIAGCQKAYPQFACVSAVEDDEPVFLTRSKP